MTRREWTRAEIGILKSCAKRGMRSTEIADVLDRSPCSVRSKARDIGVKLRPPYDGRVDVVQRARLVDFLAEHPGATLVEAGRAIGRTRETVGHMARLLVRDGVLKRTDGKRNYVRYVLAVSWRSREVTCRRSPRTPARREH